MPFLPASYLDGVVQRLMVSRAETRLGEFLIFKRALVLRRQLEGGNNVITGTQAVPFQRAILDWMGLVPDPTNNDGFFNPFGTKSAAGAYRPLKFRSNGPSDTMKRAGGVRDAPFRWIEDSSPMTFSYSPQDVDTMRKRFLSADTNRPMPRLVDAAAWWFRSREITIIPSDPRDPVDRFVRTFVQDNDLNPSEVEGLFDSTRIPDDDLVEPLPASEDAEAEAAATIEQT